MYPQDDLETQSLYEISKQQLSDLVFLDDEMKFLKGLLIKYFMPMMDDHHVNRIQLINSHLSELNLVKGNVGKGLLIQQEHLQSKIKGLESQGMDFIKLANERIEDELKDLNSSFKNIKKDIFAIYKELPDGQTSREKPAEISQK
jgi:hypothetical protein